MTISINALAKQQMKDTARQTSNYYSRLRPNQRLFAMVTLFVWGWMGVYCLTFYKPQFASESLVLIKNSAITNQYVEPDKNYVLQTTSSSAANPVLNTMGLLKSNSVSEALYDYLKIEHPETLKKLRIKNRAQWDSFYADGKKLLKAKNEPGTDLIAIKFSWDNPQVAQEGLRTVIHAFRQASLEVNRAEQEGRSRYLENQVKEINKQLITIRQKKSQYKSDMKIANLSRESDTLASTGIELGNQLATIEASARGKEEEFLKYQKILNISPENAMIASAMGLNTTMGKLHDQLYELSQKYSQLKATLTEKNPKVKEVKAEIEQVKTDIKEELKRTLGKEPVGKNHVAVADTGRAEIINKMVTARADSIRLSAEADVVRKRMAEIDEKIQGLPNMEQELNAIEDEERSLSSALSILRQRELEAHMKEAETLSNVFVVDPPRLPLKPRFPTQLHLLFIGFLLGLASGALAVFGQKKYQDLRNTDTLQSLLREVGLGPSEPVSDENQPPEKPQQEDKIIMPIVVAQTQVPAQPEEYADHETFLNDVFQDNMHQVLLKHEAERINRVKQRLYRSLKSRMPQPQSTQNGHAKRRLSEFDFSVCQH